MNRIDNFLTEISNLNCKIMPDEPLSNHLSFKIGGPARVLLEPKDKDSIIGCINLVKKYSLESFIIGNGSNLLAADQGYDGVIIKIGEYFSDLTVKDNIITASAGLSLTRLAVEAMNNSLSGLEFAYGIPGSVGGAVFMNAGAYGREISDIILCSEHIDPDGGLSAYSKDELDMGYRKSRYKTERSVILNASFCLTPGDRNAIKSRMDEILTERKSKQPLEFPSAGSVFKRPEGYYTGQLIEQAGLKGKRIGGAMVSRKHAGFIVNTGGATCKDVVELIQEIKDKIYAMFGVTLECEIRGLGFEM